MRKRRPCYEPLVEDAPAAIGRNIVDFGRLVDGVRTFGRQVRGLALQLAEGRINVAQWQLGMESAVRSHLVQQMGVGGGSAVLTAARMQTVEHYGRADGVLSRFADTMAVRQGQGNPLSEAYIANRAGAYAGAGRRRAQQVEGVVGG